MLLMTIMVTATVDFCPNSYSSGVNLHQATLTMENVVDVSLIPSVPRKTLGISGALSQARHPYYCPSNNNIPLQNISIVLCDYFELMLIYYRK